MGIDSLGPEEVEEEDSGLPGVPQAPQVQTGRKPASPQLKPTPLSEASKQEASDDLSKDSSTYKLVPESLFTLDSSDDENYTDSLTSHATASDSTIGNLTSSLEPPSSKVEVPKVISKTESQFSSSMLYLEDSTPIIPLLPSTNGTNPSIITASDRPDESVFASDLVLKPHILFPLLNLLCPPQEGALEVLKGNPLTGMEIYIPLTL